MILLLLIVELKLRKNLLAEGIEIGAGLGSFAGKVCIRSNEKIQPVTLLLQAVRVGLMGVNATVETVNKFVTVLDKVMPNSQK